MKSNVEMKRPQGLFISAIGFSILSIHLHIESGAWVCQRNLFKAHRQSVWLSKEGNKLMFWHWMHGKQCWQSHEIKYNITAIPNLNYSKNKMWRLTVPSCSKYETTLFKCIWCHGQKYDVLQTNPTGNSIFVQPVVQIKNKENTEALQ